VTAEREAERDGRVEVGAGDVPEGVDHGDDREPEGEGDADPAQSAAFCVHHDRAGSEENEREGPERLGSEATAERH
jgi:hypothetical protein